MDPKSLLRSCSAKIAASSISPAGGCGVQLGRKLNFEAHRRHLLAKMNTQRSALSNIAAMTWGPSLLWFKSGSDTALLHGV